MQTLMKFENKFDIGTGCYTTADIAKILHVPYSKVHTWMVIYWDGKLGKELGRNYSWQAGNSKAVSFHTLVEFYVMMLLSEAGVKPKEVLKAHTVLSETYNTPFPFARKELLSGIKTDGKRIYLHFEGTTIDLDGSGQLNLDFIKTFFKNLDFDGNEIASRFWPMGRKSSIVVDPERKFGHPIIDGHNIYPEVLNGMYKAGDAPEFIAALYDISPKAVKDAIAYCQAA